MQPRRSTRQSAPPDRLGFPTIPGSQLPADTPLLPDPNDPIPSIETVKQEEVEADSPSEESTGDGVDKMTDQPAFTAAQQAYMATAIAEAVRVALAANATPPPNDQRHQRSLTADLQPSTDYYLPKLVSGGKPVEPTKIKYPQVYFSNHKGDVEYDAWKMEMKLFIEEYSANFQDGAKQVSAYFKCSAGEAKTLILQHMDPAHASPVKNAADVLKALDQRFFDHNRVQTARRAYHKLEMGSPAWRRHR